MDMQAGNHGTGFVYSDGRVCDKHVLAGLLSPNR